MTSVTFYMQGPRITGFCCEGHSGFAPQGSDIVCAAVTSAIRLVETTVNDVMGLCAVVALDEANVCIVFRLPEGLSAADEDAAQALLMGLMVYFLQLHEEFPTHIEVLEA